MPSHNAAFERRNQQSGPDLEIFYQDLRDSQNRKRKIIVKRWSTIQDVKNAIAIKTQVPPQAQRLFYGPISYLPNTRYLHDAGIDRNGETLLLDIVQDDGAITEARLRIASSMIKYTPNKLSHIIQKAKRGLKLGFKPELVLDGSGGTYFLHDACKVKVAVFKPADEEPYAENNPRGYVGNGVLREGIAPGQACLREVAAFLLDHRGFSNVPMTTLAEARHAAFHTNGSRLNVSQGGASVGAHSLTPQKNKQGDVFKVGSFQAFVKAECTMDDLSPSKIEKDEVHKIAVLDIRLMNADRNSANLLCRRRPEDGSIELVPIDHGFCLRSSCDVSWMDWCWLDWPQLKEPISKKTKDYILNLDIDADCQLLKETFNIQGQALNYFRASNKLLKEGVKSGLSLYDIAILCCRNDNLGEVPSKLEMLTEMATELATSAVQNGRWHHAAASKAIVQQLSPDAGIISPTARFFKSASTVNLPSFHHLLNDDMPGMAPSSASDASSSDISESALDQDECCEDWAASLVAEVSRLPETDIRSEDDDSSLLSSSPKGFWTVPPGENLSSDDDDTVSWSPHLSPIYPKGVKDGLFCSSTSRVPFADSLSDAFLLPPAMPSSQMSSTPSPNLNFRRPSTISGLSKSQSFATFRSLSSTCENKPSSQISLPQPTEEDSNAWRSYFSNFVDLVIARETAAAAVVST